MSNDPFMELVRENGTAAFQRKMKQQKQRLAKSDADAPMKLTEMEQKIADTERQMRSYRAWKKRDFDDMDAAHPQWKQFSVTTKAMTIDAADLYLAYIFAQTWLLNADDRTRYVALALIANQIIQLRLENGYSPMDDSLPGEDPTVFEIIKKWLRVV